MTVVQQVLFELEAQYFGHPYAVSGNALFNAIARRMDSGDARALHVSHGVFVPGEYGEFPAGTSHEGYAGKLGQSLPEVESCDDLFILRDSAYRWLLDSRPRDAHNAHPLQTHGDRVVFDSTCWFGRPPGQRNRRRSVSWYVHCYLHADSEDVLPLSEEVLDELRVGGGRNYGFGALSVADTQLVDLDALDYSRVTEAAELGEAFWVELVSPYVLESEFPGADSQSVPWWWDVDMEAPGTGSSTETMGGLRRRETRFVDGADSHALVTVDHGQVVGYAGSDPVGTAKNGVLRIGTHSRFGFGEFRVRPASDDRVPERSPVEGDGVVEGDA
ncbi:hypothetical protein ACFO5R_02590 [Halosolutus amylolyticus]|uniref:Uncharacterized protein n=1 Tax=Halosolutus amylolyticus TaxID=2932267 RepID=A0ABD5PKF0_9EURY|nr:hypothetical protein [Halosolutus amylolyticus]